MDGDVYRQNNESKTSCSKDNTGHKRSHVIRKFINSAIYIEKPIANTVSNEDISVSQKYSNDDLFEVQNAQTKRCTCSVDLKTCPCHGNNFLCLTTSASSSSESKKSSVVSKTSDHKSKISRSAFISSIDNKDVTMKKWLEKKQEEKKKKEAEEKMLMEAKKKEKEALLEQERNNFKKWLVNKKNQEIEAKKKKEREMQDQQLKELEKEKRQLENQLNFQLWLKKKEEEQLEKKIKQQLEVIGELEKKEKQLRENEKAFNEWLKNSKNRQKPVPLNKGLQSLCSSTSITYRNPNPWNPAP